MLINTKKWKKSFLINRDLIMEDRHLLTVNFLLFQLLVLLILAYSYVFSVSQTSNSVILIIVGVSFIFNFWTILELARLNSIERQSLLNKEKIEQAQHLVLTLRSKHHDFINHLQVIMGLTQLDQSKQVVQYIKELSKDLIEIEKLISLKKPEVAALISSKISGLSYVQSNLEITTDLEELKVQPDKLISLLGNLLDNAIYELAFKDNKWINVKIYEKENWYIFEVTNPGTIAPEIANKVFDPGFTTKGKKGTGMGLYIVRELAENMGGEIKLNLSKEAVTFVLKLPK